MQIVSSHHDALATPGQIVLFMYAHGSKEETLPGSSGADDFILVIATVENLIIPRIMLFKHRLDIPHIGAIIAEAVGNYLRTDGRELDIVDRTRKLDVMSAIPVVAGLCCSCFLSLGYCALPSPALPNSHAHIQRGAGKHGRIAAKAQGCYGYGERVRVLVRAIIHLIAMVMSK